MNFKQKGKIISYILKLSVLAFTVLPGANRVVLFYIISHVTTTQYFAFFSSAYSYAIVMSMIGGVGVGTVIIKYGSEFGIVNYIKIASIAIILSSIAGGIIIFSFWEVTRLGIIGLLLMSIGLTMNQIIRYMIIVKKNFLIGAINEVIFILPPFVFLFIKDINIIILLGSLYIIQSLLTAFFCFVDNGKTIKLREAFIIGHSNLVSSGILYFLPIASLSLVGPVITKAVSLMITTAGIITVFPRAMLNMKIVDIQSLYNNDRGEFLKESARFKNRVACIMLLGVIIMIAYGCLINRTSSIVDIIYIGLSLSLFIFMGQYTILETTLINLVGKENISLILNSLSFIFFVGVYYILKIIDLKNTTLTMFLLCSIVFISYSIRYYIINKVLNEVEKCLL